MDGVSDKQFPVMLQWERPAHINRYTIDPVNGEGTGDLKLFPERNEFDLDRPRAEFRSAQKMIEDAPEEVQNKSSQYSNLREIFFLKL